MTLRLAMLSPITWRTPPLHYGPWENVTSLLADELVAMGVDVTLFATGNSQTSGKLEWVSARPCSESPTMNPKVWECLHISNVFEQAHRFDLIHNHFDFLPLSYSQLVDTPMITTIHGFSSQAIYPVFKKYNSHTHYVAISEADKNPYLDYAATIHHGINMSKFALGTGEDEYLLFFGRIHHDKGVREAIEVAKRTGIKLLIAGIIQDEQYYQESVAPWVDGKTVEYIGPVDAEDKSRVLGGARALLHLINFDEPFGLSVVESMACGTPVIAFGRGSVPEIVREGKTGFIVDHVDAAAVAVGRLSELDRLACREHVLKRYSVRAMAAQYLQTYERILAARENERPWGRYDNLDEYGSYKIKRIVVHPGKRLSLQKHQQRAEHWVVVQGKAVATVNSDRKTLDVGDSVDIGKGVLHRVENPGDEPLVFVEVQTGDYFGEDDIQRIEDDFGRADSQCR